MINYLTNVVFGDISLSDFGALAISTNIMDTPARSRDIVSVPGRNGALIYDNGRYDDVSREYVVVVDSFEHAINLIRRLKAITGYARLTDGFESDVYMTARIESITNPVILLDSVRIVITFTRKPQKFLVSGETPITFTSSSSLSNPTYYEALPLVRVYGTGTVSIAGTIITINSNSGYTDIDCDLQDARYGTTNRNGNITLTSGYFWTLKPGNNNISLGSGISQIRITPRWWTL